MISGAHFLLYSTDPVADRRFLRDVLGFRAVDAGDGWLIFALPPAEIGIHPASGPFVQRHAEHELLGAVLYLMCDDVRATVKALQGKGVAAAEIEEAEWGLTTTIRLPSGGEIGLYQPTHPTAVAARAVPSVSAFFDSYRTAFERLDAPAIADHYTYPSHVTSDTGEIVLISLATKQDWIAKIEHLLGMYRAIGFSSARALDVAATELSPQLAQVIVHWVLYDRAGRLLYDFDATYTLAGINDAWRIAALSHNEIPRYRACLATLRQQ